MLPICMTRQLVTIFFFLYCLLSIYKKSYEFILTKTVYLHVQPSLGEFYDPQKILDDVYGN